MFLSQRKSVMCTTVPFTDLHLLLWKVYSVVMKCWVLWLDAGVLNSNESKTSRAQKCTRLSFLKGCSLWARSSRLTMSLNFRISQRRLPFTTTSQVLLRNYLAFSSGMNSKKFRKFFDVLRRQCLKGETEHPQFNLFCFSCFKCKCSRFLHWFAVSHLVHSENLN